VYSVNTFPYLVLSGRALVERHFREVRRVLRSGGAFVLFNYAYGRSSDWGGPALSHEARMEKVRILYLSPGFPPNSHLLRAAAHARGARVLAAGDMPESALAPQARHALDGYVFEPRMGEYEGLPGVVRSMLAEHGPIDFVESNGEHWLEV